MLMRIVHAVAIGFIAALVLLFVGGVILANLPFPIVQDAGAFFVRWAWWIGLGVGLLDFVSGGFGPSFGPRP